MLGAIIGDIVGSRYEFDPTNDYNFEMFAPGSDFTDDTVCTIAIADAWLKGRDYGDSLHEWCRKYPHPKGGYGGRFREWVMSDDPKPYGSFGNGSAMRVSSIGWLYDQPGDILGEAAKSAECTHNHEAGIEGAQAVAAAISDCRKLRAEKKGQPLSRDEILGDGLYHGIMCYMMNPYDFQLNLEDYRNKFDETCQGTVPVAFAIILESNSFEDAIRRAVSLGADADTLGAIVGSIAEALWGIPEWMKKKALSYLPQEMRDVLTEFNQRIITAH
ncbi:MAG: ADP-ribosylglycohydrolase family protein [Bacteroidales bacterium]|nr:ADP-ribosylglycohydrolase family protein [Bacteroidales bacterium]